MGGGSIRGWLGGGSEISYLPSWDTVPLAGCQLGHHASGWLFGNEYKNEIHWLETPERVLTCFWVGVLL